MRLRSGPIAIALLVVLGAASYMSCARSSKGTDAGRAKHGRVVDQEGKPVRNAWVLGQWIGYYRGVHGGERSIVVAADVQRTGDDGAFQFSSKEAALSQPLDRAPDTSGHYAFGLLVFAPGMRVDAARSPYCLQVGKPSEPFLCPTTKATNGEQDELVDLILRPDSTGLADRAKAYALWNEKAFVDSAAVPAIAPRGTTSVAIGAVQTKELADLACNQTDPVPFAVVDHIESAIRWPLDASKPPVETFKSIALPETPCADVAERCAPVAADKVCAALRATLGAHSNQESHP